MRRLLILACLSLPALTSGCALCCAPHDCDYPYVGGKWVRLNPSSGRVGSAFDEAGAPAGTVPPPTAGEALPPTGGVLSPPPAGQPVGPMQPGARSVIPRNLGENYLQP
jgi:hypothetical protein